MRGTLSFHGVDLAFFDETVASLVAGRKVNPDAFVVEALRVRQSAWHARRYVRALESVLASGGPPQAAPDAGLLQKIKSRLELFDYRPDELTRRVARVVDPDLHLRGRPFLVGESAAPKVAEVVDRYRAAASPRAADALAKEQLARLDPELAKEIEPEDGPSLSADLLYRSDLLAEMSSLHDLARAARDGATWDRGAGPPGPADEALPGELPWRAASLHARIAPFWIARDVDGLETICRASGVLSPEFLVPAWRLLAEACGSFPALRESLHLEVTGARDVGAFVAPQDVPRLVDFLDQQGARIIQAASRQGEGAACTTLLRKIKECATYAVRHQLGYLEASGVVPPDLLGEEA